MKPSVAMNCVGFVQYDPATQTTPKIRGIVASVTDNGPGDFIVNLDPNNALDPGQSYIVIQSKGAIPGDVTAEANHQTDVAIEVATLIAGVVNDVIFEMAIYDLGPA